MGLFRAVEGDNAIIVERGVYRQCELYTKDGWLFAKLGNGFIRLLADGSTSKAAARIETLAIEGELAQDAFGRLALASVRSELTPIAQATMLRLTAT